MGRSLRTLFIGAAALALAAGVAPTAYANGRPPASVKLHFRPGHPNDIAAAMTFGLLVSHDGGTTWDWICEQALPFAGNYDPDYEYAESGAIFATTVDGLRVQRDGCTFEAAGTGSKFVSTEALGPNSVVIAAMSDLTAPADSGIYLSTDDGLTFPTHANPGIAGDWWQSLEIAPSNPMRVYLAGYRLDGANNKTLLMFRSDDGAQSFTPITTSNFGFGNTSVLEVAAISPSNPDLLFARVTFTNNGDTSIGDTFYRSDDAGMTWTSVLTLTDAAPAFVFRANGDVIAGTSSSGQWKSTDGGKTFSQLATSPQYRCLSEDSTGQLWDCANDFAPDNGTIGKSPDGVTWTPVLTFAQINGPVMCPSTTVQYQSCQVSLWCGLVAQYGITSTTIDCSPTPDAGPVDAMPVTPPGGKGCCDVNNEPVGAVMMSLVTLGLLVLRRRR